MIPYQEEYIETLLAKMMGRINERGNIIIGYDFDDTVHPTNKKDTPDYYEDVRQVLRELNDTGFCRFICITCREEPTEYLVKKHKYERMAYVEKYLFENGIPYNAINQNLPWGLPDDPRKIYCSIMIDDKSGLPLMLYILQKLVEKIKRFQHSMVLM
jgi:hypothetical protein